MSKQLIIGQKIKIISLPPYLKTADSIPMLRPPDLIQIGEEGIILDQRPGGYWGIKLNNGSFLLEEQYIEPI